jgi:hypothetical protein
MALAYRATRSTHALFLRDRSHGAALPALAPHRQNLPGRGLTPAADDPDPRCLKTEN